MRLRATSACLSAVLLSAGLLVSGCADPGAAPAPNTNSNSQVEDDGDEADETVTETVDEEESPAPSYTPRTVGDGEVKGALTVLAPDSLKGSMPAAADGFQKKNPGVQVKVVYLPSEQLAAEVVSGKAKADVVIAGSSNDFSTLFSKNAVGEPSIIARSVMALVVPKANPKKIGKVSDLAGKNVGMCAAAAGCGPAGAELLGAAKVNAGKVVRGPGAAGVIDLVAKGRADAGIVGLVDAKAAGAVKTVEVPDNLKSVQLTFLAAPALGTKNGGTAKSFIGFLALDPIADAALKKAGLETM
ncbi:MAG: extracellular solute-binding protein [Kineosporiaceae bacterium]